MTITVSELIVKLQIFVSGSPKRGATLLCIGGLDRETLFSEFEARNYTGLGDNFLVLAPIGGEIKAVQLKLN